MTDYTVLRQPTISGEVLVLSRHRVTHHAPGATHVVVQRFDGTRGCGWRLECSCGRQICGAKHIVMETLEARKSNACIAGDFPPAA